MLIKSFHLIGQNIKSSLSPFIHNNLFKLKGKQQQYKYQIFEKENYLLRLEEMVERNVKGLSITIPFKQGYEGMIKQGRIRNGIVEMVRDNGNKPIVKDLQTQPYKKITAQQILAKRYIINTLVQRQHQENNTQKQSITNGQKQLFESRFYFQCYNTDIFGIKMSFSKNVRFFQQIFLTNSRNRTTMNKKQNIQQIQPINQSLDETIVIIMGGGATAQVFMSYFQQLQLPMIIINRSREKIIKLKETCYSMIRTVYGLENIIKNDKNSRLEQQQKKWQITRYHHYKKTNLFKNIILINTLPTKIFKQQFYLPMMNSFQQSYFLQKQQKTYNLQCLVDIENNSTTKNNNKLYLQFVKMLQENRIFVEDDFDKDENRQNSTIDGMNKLENVFYMDVNYRDGEECLKKFVERIIEKNRGVQEEEHSFEENKRANISINSICTGLDMLIWQGILQNYLFCLSSPSHQLNRSPLISPTQQQITNQFPPNKLTFTLNQLQQFDRQYQHIKCQLYQQNLI